MHRATHLLAVVFGRRDWAVFEVFDGSVIRVPLSDRYWIPVLLGRRYEPEIAFVLSQVLTPETAFIDGGANVGWWSLFASRVIRRSQRILAIEASSHTFHRLSETAAINDRAFTCLNAALWDRSDERLALDASREYHMGNRVLAVGHIPPIRPPSTSTESVCSIRLEDALALLQPGWDALIVKLDIEGAEARALEGLGGRLQDVDLLIFEDHGQSSDAAITREVITRGLQVFYVDGEFGVRQIRNEHEAKAIKRIHHRGYNFFASPPDSETFRLLVGLTRKGGP